MQDPTSTEYPLVSKTGKRYRYVSPGIREYESGTMYDESKGRGGLIRSPKAALFNPDNAREMQAAGIQSRLESKQAAIREGARLALVDKLSRTNKGNISVKDLPENADVEAIGYALMEKLTDKYAPNSVAAAKLYMEQQDMLPKRVPDATVSQGENAISGSPEFVERMLRLMAQVGPPTTPAHEPLSNAAMDAGDDDDEG